MGCGIGQRLIWWFGTFFIFHNKLNNPFHWLIFFKMVETTNQWCLVMKTCDYSCPKGYQEMREHLETGEHKQQIRIGGRCPNGFRGLARTEMVCGLLSASRNLTSNHIETIHASQFCWLLRLTLSHRMFHETNKPRLSLKFTDYCPYFAHKSSNCTVWVWIKTHWYWRQICGGWTSIAANYFNGYKCLNSNIHMSWIYAYNCIHYPFIRGNIPFI